MRCFKISLFFLLGLLATSVAADDRTLDPYSSYRVQTYELQIEYLRQVTRHQEAVMLDLEAKLGQQAWQTNAIAVMVFVMVSVGLYLSYLQFRLDRQEGATSSFTLKVGGGSFEVSSSVIGLIILILSFWFFQAYIDRVYSVEIVEIPPIDMTTFGVNR